MFYIVYIISIIFCAGFFYKEYQIGVKNKYKFTYKSAIGVFFLTFCPFVNSLCMCYLLVEKILYPK